MSRTEKMAVSKQPTLGIDVSRHQGRIDWDQVARARIRNPVTGRAEPIRFAIIRSSGSESVDTEFRRNWSEAKRVGLLRGPYVAITASAYRYSPVDYYENLARALGPSGLGFWDLPPFLDHEKGQSDVPTDEQSRRNVAVVRGIADLIQGRMGRRCGVYTGAYWQWTVPRDVQARLSEHPLWVPDYRTIERPGPWSARIPDGWGGFYIRQYTSQARIPGITANTCDVNLYDGGQAALRSFILKSHLAGNPIAATAVLGALGVGGYVLYTKVGG